MFCGDETGAIVVDTGSFTSKFGWGGEDLPKIVFSSVSATCICLPSLKHTLPKHLAVKSVGVQYEPNEAGKARSSEEKVSKKYHVGTASRYPRKHMEIRQPFDFNQGNCGDI